MEADRYRRCRQNLICTAIQEEVTIVGIRENGAEQKGQ
jgi:hypothetical protein